MIRLSPKQQRIVQILTGILMLVVAGWALPSGWMLVQDSTGASLGLDIDALRGSEFEDYYAGGMFLVIFNGLGMALGALACFTGWRHAGNVGIVLGAGLIFFMLVQVTSIGFSSLLQPIFIGMGMVIFSLAWWMRGFPQKDNSEAPAEPFT